ncbi:MAG: pyridoxamine 5'-phosphate oxidase family protein [Pseudomonadales bacterium]
MSKNAVVARFNEERQQAREAADPMAALLSLATVSAAGAPEVRTLVLRDVVGELAIFINRTSPKWQALQANQRLQFMTYWPSSMLQYRFDCTCSEIDSALVHPSWLLRPESPRRLDHVYEKQAPQSSAVQDRAQLLAQAATVSAAQLETPTANAIGLFLQPSCVERLDLNMDGAPHDRRRYRSASGWQEEVLVP